MHIAVAFYWFTVNEVTIEEFGNMALRIIQHSGSAKFNLVTETHEETEVLCWIAERNLYCLIQSEMSVAA